jgi:hypothetical protein
LKTVKINYKPRKRAETQQETTRAIDEAHRKFWQSRGLHPPPVSASVIGGFAYYAKSQDGGLKISRTY